MKKNFVTRLVLMVLCLILMLPTAVAETRDGVIFLEGMEEPIVETLFESPKGFSFWYVGDRLSASDGDIFNIDGIVVSALYADDYMVLSMIPEEEAVQNAANFNIDIKALSAETRIQLELFLDLADGQYRFGTMIAEKGKYMQAVGQYSQEAAEGNAKFFQLVLDSVTLQIP